MYLRPGRRSTWITTLSESAMLVLIARYGSSTPLCRTQLVNRARPCCAEFAWMVDNVPECPVFRSCKKIEGFAAANLTKNDAVRAVAEGCFQEVADGHCRKAVLFPAGFKPNEIFLRQLNFGRVFDNEDSLVLGNEFSED